MIDVVMPQMGESIVEGTLTKWLKKAGDHVERDEPLFEISTDKVDTEIPSPSAGTLSEIIVEEGKTVGINTVVGRISDGASPAAAPAVVIRVAAAAPAPVPAPAPAPAPRAGPCSTAPTPARWPRLLRLRQPAPVMQAQPTVVDIAPASEDGRPLCRRWSGRWRARTISTCRRVKGTGAGGPHHQAGPGGVLRRAVRSLRRPLAPQAACPKPPPRRHHRLAPAAPARRSAKPGGSAGSRHRPSAGERSATAAADR
jgi:pyruvate dehydrogenase E2 component (dihydrolipoamide acetyltransferase)